MWEAWRKDRADYIKGGAEKAIPLPAINLAKPPAKESMFKVLLQALGSTDSRTQWDQCDSKNYPESDFALACPPGLCFRL